MKFPQSIFAEKIIAALKKNDTKMVIDAPCGDGFVTMQVAKAFPEVKVIGVDIADCNIKSVYENLSFEQKDIHQFIEKLDIIENFCLVNSLFLLPEPIELLENIFSKMKNNGKLLLIIPNIESRNFKNYQKIEPKINTFVVSNLEMKEVLKKVGFVIKQEEAIVFTTIFGRIDVKLFFFMRDKYLHFLEKKNQKQDKKVGAYWFFICQKSLAS